MMNPINRIGQKVICVQDHLVWADFCCGLAWPVLDEIYTVSAFGEIEGCPGIFLFELPPVSCSCHQLSGAPWPIECFRPLDWRTTDISNLVKILDQTHTNVEPSKRQTVDATVNSRLASG